MNTKNGFIYDIDYNGKKHFYFVTSNKQKRNTSDAIKLVNELEIVLGITKEKYGNMYEVTREMSIKTIKQYMKKVTIKEYNDCYAIYERYSGYILGKDEITIFEY